MHHEHDESGSRLPDAALRGAVALLGVASLAIALRVAVAIVSFLNRDPQSAAEAHAMAHSVPGILVGGILGVGGVGLAGVALLAVAYVDRRRLSAGTLLAAGLVGILLLSDPLGAPATAASIGWGLLGGYALYEDVSGRGPLAFVSGVTAVLWLLHVFVLLWLGSQLIGLLPVNVSSALLVWGFPLLDVGAVTLLAAAVRRRYLGRTVSRARVTLAAVVLLEYLPGAVWAAMTEYLFAGLTPLEWLQLIVGTAAALVLFGRSFGRSGHR